MCSSKGRNGTLADQEDNLEETDGFEGVDEDAAATNSTEMEVSELTTLVEVSPGVAVLFGEIPEGVELLNLPLMPEEDRSALESLVALGGNVASMADVAEQSMQAAQGLYRMDTISRAVLDTGGKLAQKDGANLGAIFLGGKVERQVRWIRVDAPSLSAVATAAGPAVAMMALQAQLGNIEDLVAANIALTRQTLKTIRAEQWSELEGLTQTINRAFAEAHEVGAITSSVWEPIRSYRSAIDKQMRLYRRHISEHISKVRELEGQAKREYLENEAEAILFDSQALLQALRAYAQFRALRAGRVRMHIEQDEAERALFEKLTRETPRELEEDLEEVRALIVALTRELRVIAELPGRLSVPLTKKRRDKKRAAMTCAALLEVMEPLADVLQPVIPPIELEASPHTPEDADLSGHLNIMRWHLEPGEVVRALALIYAMTGKSAVGVIPAVLGRRVDATWEKQGTGFRGALERLSGGSLAVLTDRRVMVADEEKLRRQGQLDLDIPLESIQLVRVLSDHHGSVRAAVEILSDRGDVKLLFPKALGEKEVAAFANSIEEARALRTEDLKALAVT